MRLSVKILISAVSATSVVLVTAVTLSIALVTGFSAIHSLGTSHAGVLRDVAVLKTGALFNARVQQHELVKNGTLGHPEWGLPTENPNATAHYVDLLREVVLLPGNTQGSSIFFADNTRVSWDMSPLHYTLTVQFASPFSDFPNQTIWLQPAKPYLLATHREVPAGFDLSGLPPTVPLLSKHRTVASSHDLWSDGFAATVGGRRSLISSPILETDVVPSQAADGSFRYMEVPVLSIPYVTPLLNPNATAALTITRSDLLGLYITSMTFQELNLFLSSVKSTPNTLAVVYDDNRYLLGTSDVDRPATEERTEGGTGCVGDESTNFLSVGVILCRFSVVTYGHPALAGMAESRPDLLTPAVPTVERVDLGSEGSHYVATAPVMLDYGGLTMFLALLMPEADVIGDVVRGRTIAISISAALVVILAALNFVIVVLALRPLDRIAERMVRAANLDDDEAEERLSAMAEVAVLQEAYFAMNAELNRIRSYVPQTVLYARRADDDDDDDEEAATDEWVKGAEPTHGSQNKSNSRSRSGTDDRMSTSGRPTSRSASRTASRTGKSSLSPLADAAINTLRVKVPVTVVAGNVEGFHGRLAGTIDQAREAVSALGTVVEVAEEAVAGRRGVVTFHGDRFFGTFNAARACPGGHGRRGVESALAVAQGADGTQPGALRVRCGVALGPCAVGPVGSATTKAFSTMGPAFTHAAIFERLTRRYGAGCRVLTSQRVTTDAQGLCYARAVDLLALEVSPEAPLIPTVACAVLPREPSATQDDEWLYLLDEGKGEHAREHLRLLDDLNALRSGKVAPCWLSGPKEDVSTVPGEVDGMSSVRAGKWGTVLVDSIAEVKLKTRAVVEARRQRSTEAGEGTTLTNAEVLQVCAVVTPVR